MVRRFIQQQDVRALEDDACEVRPGALAAGELLEGTAADVRVQIQSVCDLFQRELRLVPALRLEAGGQLAVAPQQRGA